MPIYEYECKKCGHQFEKHMSMEDHDHDKDKVQCPKCQSTEVGHLIESVNVTTSKKS